MLPRLTNLEQWDHAGGCRISYNILMAQKFMYILAKASWSKFDDLSSLI